MCSNRSQETDMSSNPKVLISVVTPFHNSASTLARAIESVTEQTDVEIEYILADNCSTDGSGEIARGYAARDARIKYRHFEELVPQVPNYNRATRLASGTSRFIKIVQADDFILPGCLLKMATLGLKHPSVGVIGAFREVGEEIDPPLCTPLAEVENGPDLCRRGLWGGPLPFGSPTTVMYRADLVRARADFFTAGAAFDDTDAAMELLQVSDFGFVREILTHTTRDPNSTIGRVLSFDLPQLYRFMTTRRIGHAYFDETELRVLDRHVTDAYYAQVVRSLVRRRDRADYAAFHRSALWETAGVRWSPGSLAKAVLQVASNVTRRQTQRFLGATPQRL
jgi:glycosyltransferase involved in cell wall biosynthesis